MFVLALVFVSGAFLAGTVWSPSERVSFELRKHLIQFFLVTALGALVGVVVYERRQRREAAERERQYVVDSISAVLRQLDATYRSVKKTRRLLRLPWSRGPDREAYVDATLKLDEDQQDLEQLKRELETLERLARDVHPIRAARLRQARNAVALMEKYLGAIWKEHERVAKLSDDEFTQHGLPLINAFVARAATRKSGFPAFNTQFYVARDKLLELLAEGRLGQRGDARDRRKPG
jgi:hypothetical protein